MPSKLTQRFDELDEQYGRVLATKKSVYSQYDNRHTQEVDSKLMLAWEVNAKHLIETAYGKDSQHLKHFEEASTAGFYSQSFDVLERMGAVFAAAKEDYQASENNMTIITYCQNGHYIGTSVRRARSSGQIQAEVQRMQDAPSTLDAFCTQCGAAAITSCEHCQAPINPKGDLQKPNYCGACGKPFPWTTALIDAAVELARESTSADDAALVILRESMSDLSVDSPRTELAIVRVKKFIANTGKAIAPSLTKMAFDLGTDAVKKHFGL